MLGSLFKKRDSIWDSKVLLQEFYKQEKEVFFAQESPIPQKIYELSQLMETEQEEVNSPQDFKIPSPYWEFYYWVGNCLTALDPYNSHPLQPRDESYSADAGRAARHMAKTPRIFAQIKSRLEARSGSNFKVIMLELGRLQQMLEEKLRKFS